MVDSEQLPEDTNAGRFEWLDQARGTIVLFLPATMMAAALAGGNARLRPILAPTFLTHGSHFANVQPRMITLVDHGTQIFVFMLGFVGYQAFMKRYRDRPLSGWVYLLRRSLILLLVGMLMVAVREWRGDDAYNWVEALWEGTFAKLAIGTLAGGIGIRWFPKPRQRIIVACLLMMIHMIAWGVIEFTVELRDGWPGQAKLPWGAWNTVAVILIATAFGQRVFEQADSVREGMRRYLFPGIVWTGVSCYIASWLQHAVTFEVTTAHALGGILCSLMLLMGMFAASELDLAFPMLTALGRNLFVMFLVGGVGTVLYGEFLMQQVGRESLIDSPFLVLLLCGIVPYLVIFLLARWMDGKQIYIRP